MNIIKIVKSVWVIFLLMCVWVFLVISRKFLYRENLSPENAYTWDEWYRVETTHWKIFVIDKNVDAERVVVFIHWFGARWKTFEMMYEELNRQWYRTITIDIPPFWFSEVYPEMDRSVSFQEKRIWSVIQALWLESYHIVWHSIGSRLVMEHVMLHEKDIISAILLSPALTPSSWSKISWWNPFSSSVFREYLVWATLTNKLLAKKMLWYMVYDPSHITESHVAIYTQPSRKKDMSMSVWDWLYYVYTHDDASVRQDHKKRANLRLPFLLIRWKNDTITPLEQWVELNTHLQDSTLKVFDNMWHIPHLENPKETVWEIVDFLSSVE